MPSSGCFENRERYGKADASPEQNVDLLPNGLDRQRLRQNPVRAGGEALPRNLILDRIRDYQNLRSRYALANLRQHADAFALHDRSGEQNQVWFAFSGLGEGWLQTRHLMRLIFIMQHELQGGADDFVVVDNEDPLVFDSSRCLNADLHLRSLLDPHTPDGCKLHTAGPTLKIA
ncbi:protein of unknown function [Methylocella tundrae]|uniref:Uncharacterized protein n=1 Tax=Methylocella tundrae TaxID=227605 RepID=A0A4U8Z1S6_METTU|nr:protein of unknown function [Methylocella tundrae]